MKRGGLLMQVFLSILVVSLVTVLAAGAIIRGALDSTFETYVTTMGAGRSPGSGMGPGSAMGPGSGMGRQLFLGTAEQAFLASMDRGIVTSVSVAVLLAALAALLLAARLVRPLRQLTSAARTLAAGDLEHRVATGGPREVEELAEAFNDMAASLADAEALRRRMVSDVAHELRNPIAVLRAQIEGIAEGVLPADEARVASLVEDAGTLSRLVDDLQELSIAEAGRLRYDRVRFDLGAAVTAEAGSERSKRYLRPGVTLAVSAPVPVAMVKGDQFRIAQVVRNLLSNAGRHTPSGAVSVQITVAANRVRVAVTDTGEGISPADLPYIWERFYRADSARAADTGGAGVGLAISKRIIEDHGGTIFADSTPGAGSSIGFELPLDQEPSA